MKYFSITLALFITLLSHSTAFASGGYGGGYSSGSSYTPPPIDQRYERGKALIKGRIQSVGKVKLCMDYKEKQKSLGKKTLKPYKSTSRDAVIDKIYVCDSPETKASDVLKKADLLDIMYYFNKRYKLKLN